MAVSTSSNDTVSLLSVGDVGPFIEPVDQLAELLPPHWHEADFRLAQCERTYSERGIEPQYKQSKRNWHTRLPQSMASVWKRANIDIISLASNHAMDWGPDPVLDTCELFRGMGKYVIGAGRDGEAARMPAIVERKGVRIACLAYCSVLREGQAAGPNKAGVAPMRAHTHYMPDDFQPGCPPTVFSYPDEHDLDELEKDIAAAKQRADAVVVVLHWGIRLVPKTLATYQPTVAHAAIDAGADLILGHHMHTPKAVEVYKGKVCFYSLGNFMLHGSMRKPTEWNLMWFPIDAETYPPHGKYYFPSHCRNTLIAKAQFSERGVERVSFLPAIYINPQAQPVVLAPGEPKFDDVLRYMEWVSDDHAHKFTVDGGEVVVEAAA